MESYSICLFATSLFHLADCPQGLSHAVACDRFSLLFKAE